MDSIEQPVDGNAAAPAAAAIQPCCEKADAASRRSCELCGKNAVCKFCRHLVNGSKWVCAACREQILAELKAEEAQTPHLLAGAALGAVAAVAGGAVWAAVAIITHLAIGYVAIGVGYLAGFGVWLGAGRKKGS